MGEKSFGAPASKGDSARKNHEKEMKKKELRKWDGGKRSDEYLLETDREKWDQFKINEELFGVKPSFDENEYTMAIDRRSQKYLSKKKEIDKVAAEIERNKTIEPEECNIGEEQRFSAVGCEASQAEQDISAAPSFEYDWL